MPLYSVQHATQLTSAQQDALAAAITRIHSTKFTTPKMFVNVTFQDVSTAVMYTGGRRANKNFITANVRHGPSRTQGDYADLIGQIQKAWEKEVPGEPLRGFVVMGSIVAGMEADLLLPQAGGDRQWITENWDAFNQKAQAGDTEFQELVEEVKERGLLQDGKSAIQRMEEALGWGDAA